MTSGGSILYHLINLQQPSASDIKPGVKLDVMNRMKEAGEQGARLHSPTPLSSKSAASKARLSSAAVPEAHNR